MEESNRFNDTEITILRKIYEIERSMKRCGQTEEYLEKHFPQHLDLWGKFIRRGLEDYKDGKCKTFVECYEKLLWPIEWINGSEKIPILNGNNVNPKFQSLLRRLFKNQKIIVLDD